MFRSLTPDWIGFKGENDEAKCWELNELGTK